VWLCVAFDGLSITSIGGLYHFLGFVDIARVTAGVDYERHSLHSIVQLSRNDRCTCAVVFRWHLRIMVITGWPNSGRRVVAYIIINVEKLISLKLSEGRHS